ncbi:MAG: HAD-IA family hydrolase [Promethearchaeia archaeon]
MSKSKKKATRREYQIGTQKVRLYKIDHFIFDFGQVLSEKTFVLDNLVQVLRDDLQIEIDRYSPFFKKYRRRLSSGIITAREFLEILMDKYYYPYQKKKGPLPPKDVNIDYYLELWFQFYYIFTELSTDMEEIIERLHTAGYTVSLLSNTYDIHAKSNELLGFFDLFDYVFLSNELGMRKPDIEKYKYVVKKLNTEPKRCIFIDDKLRNLIPAHELGMIVIRFKSFDHFRKTLSDMGIEEISRNLRKKIKKKYKRYKKKKKQYRKAKKLYKKAKKAYKKAKKKYKKKKNLKRELYKRRKKYKVTKEDYKEKKQEYKKEKRKKEELVSNIKID